MKKILVLLLIVFLTIACSNKKEELEKLYNQGPSSIPKIAEYLKDPDLEVRKMALFYLGKLGSKEAIPYIEEYANSAKNPAERNMAIKTIAKINEIVAKKNPPKPKYQPKPVNPDDPLQVQVQNFVWNFQIKDNPYYIGDTMKVEVRGHTVINWTDMTDYYNETKRIKDWKTFYEYLKRTVLGFPTGDLAGAIFDKFPQIKVFKEYAYVCVKYEGKDGKKVCVRKKVIGKATITRKNYNRIDKIEKEYLDKLSVSSQHFDEFEKEAKKFVKGIWYDPVIVRKAKAQKAQGVE